MNCEIDISRIAIELIEDHLVNYLNGCSIFRFLKILPVMILSSFII